MLRTALYWLTGRPLFALVGKGYVALMGASRRVPGYPWFERWATARTRAVFRHVRIPERFATRLEPFLEANRCRAIDPVIIMLVWMAGGVLGAWPTAGGILKSTPFIFGLLAMVSGMNPFLGLTTALVFAGADLATKLIAVSLELSGLVLPAGVAGWFDTLGLTALPILAAVAQGLGLLVGAVLAYSTMALTGVAPGISARVFRLLTYNVAVRVLPSTLAKAVGFCLMLAAAGPFVWWIRGPVGLVWVLPFALLPLAGVFSSGSESGDSSRARVSHEEFTCAVCGKHTGALPFCQFCYAPAQGQGGAAALAQVHCTKCGSAVSAGAPYCWQCNSLRHNQWNALSESEQAEALRVRSTHLGIQQEHAQTVGSASAPPAALPGATSWLIPMPVAFNPASALAEAIATVGAIAGATVGLGAAYQWMAGPGDALETGARAAAASATSGTGGASAGAAAATSAAAAGGGASGGAPIAPIDWDKPGWWSGDPATLRAPTPTGLRELEQLIDWDARHPGHDMATPLGRNVMITIGSGESYGIATEPGFGARWVPGNNRPNLAHWHAAPDGNCTPVVFSGSGEDVFGKILSDGNQDVTFADGSVERRRVIVRRLFNQGDGSETQFDPSQPRCRGVDPILEVVYGPCDDCVVTPPTSAAPSAKTAVPTPAAPLPAEPATDWAAICAEAKARGVSADGLASMDAVVACGMVGQAPTATPYPHFGDLAVSAGPAAAVGAAMPPGIAQALTPGVNPQAAAQRVSDLDDIVSGSYEDGGMFDRHNAILDEARKQGDVDESLLARLREERDAGNAGRQAQWDEHSQQVQSTLKTQDAERALAEQELAAVNTARAEHLSRLRAAAGERGMMGNDAGHANVYGKADELLKRLRQGEHVSDREIADVDRIIRRDIHEGATGRPTIFDGSAASQARVDAEAIREGLKGTSREIFTGVTADGSTSFKAMALHGLLGSMSGGASGVVGESIEGLYAVGDGIMAGKSTMQSLGDATANWAKGQAIGKGISGGLGAAVHLGKAALPALTDLAGKTSFAKGLLRQTSGLADAAQDLTKRIELAQKHNKPEYIHSLYRQGGNKGAGMAKLGKMEELGHITKAQADYMNKTMTELAEKATRKALPGATAQFEKSMKRLGVPVKVKEIMIGDSGSSAKTGGARSVKTDADRTIVATFDPSEVQAYADRFHGSDARKAYADLNQRVTNSYTREVDNVLGDLTGFKTDHVGGQPVTRAGGALKGSDIGFDAYSGVGRTSGKIDSYGEGFTNVRQSVQGRTQVFDPKKRIDPVTGEVRVHQASSDAIGDQWQKNRFETGSGAEDLRQVKYGDLELPDNLRQQVKAVEGLDGASPKAQLQQASKAVTRAEDFGRKMEGPGAGRVLDPEIVDVAAKLRKYPQQAPEILSKAGMTNAEFIERAKAAVTGYAKSRGI